MDYFKPFEFVKNLKVMGVGLLGVFIIVGIIIAATYGISYFTAKIGKKNDDAQQ